MHPLLDPIDVQARERAAHRAVCDEYSVLNYAQFRSVAAGLSQRIAQACPAERVGILAPTSAACAVAVAACWYARKIPVPLNFMLAPNELEKVLRDAELGIALCAARFSANAQSLGLRVLSLEPDALTPGACATPAVEPGDLGALLYTSGTSGDPKGVCLTFDNLAQNARACIAATGMTADHVFLGLLPQFHAFGLTATTIVPLMLGATVIYHSRFSPVQVVRTIQQERVSTFITIASMFGALAGMKNAGPADFATLELPVSGGEPLSPRVAQAWEQRFGRRIYEGYGMTEASPVVTLNTPAAYRAGTVGRPLPGISVVAVDADGRALPAGGHGELVVRGHCVMQGYLNKPDETAAVLRDGALRTGDVGCVDADGFVTITGRAKEMLIVGGENVLPVEIERVLLECPGVLEAAVIGRRDEIRGEVPIAYVIAAPGAALSEASLREQCRARLAPYKVPREIRIVAELPRGPTGKVLKRALADAAQQCA